MVDVAFFNAREILTVLKHVWSPETENFNRNTPQDKLKQDIVIIKDFRLRHSVSVSLPHYLGKDFSVPVAREYSTSLRWLARNKSYHINHFV